MEARDFEQRLLEFNRASLSWCVQESEKSTEQISLAIDLLLKDAARVSELSEDSLHAIQGLQKELKLRSGSSLAGTNMVSLIKTLTQLAHEHEEIQGVVKPIIQSLQFQDRLRQNLENFQKMIPIWLQYRKRIAGQGQFSESDLSQMAEELRQKTTMKSERDVLRKHFPDVPEEEEAPAVSFF